MHRVVLPLGILFVLPLASRGEDAAAAFKKRVLPILEAHCTTCHGGDKPKAKLNLAGPRTLEQLRAQSRQWFRALERVEAGSMPPENAKPLTLSEKQILAGWVRGERKIASLIFL